MTFGDVSGPTIDEFMRFIEDNTKSASQVKADILEEKCEPVSVFVEQPVENIAEVRYTDGKIFKKNGQDFHTEDFICFAIVAEYLKSVRDHAANMLLCRYYPH